MGREEKGTKNEGYGDGFCLSFMNQILYREVERTKGYERDLPFAFVKERKGTERTGFYFWSIILR